jgi:hypothetical protein
VGQRSLVFEDLESDLRQVQDPAVLEDGDGAFPEIRPAEVLEVLRVETLDH